MKYILFINYRRLLKEAIAGFDASRKLGFQVMLIASNLPKELETFVNKFIKVESNTVQNILPLIKDYEISAVVPSTETSIEITSLIEKELGLKGMNPENVKFVRDKSAMREKISHPSKVITTDEDITLFLNEFGFPSIIKPINASGSTGIYVINTSKDLDIFFQNRNSVSNPTYDINLKKPSTTFVIEKYIDGTEVSVEGFVYSGKVKIIGITSKETTEEWKLEIEHIFPEKLTPEITDLIHAKTTEYVLKLGLDNTSFHLEGKYNSKGFELIEVAGRPAGGYIASHLIKLSTGYDFYENLIRVSLGKEPLEPKMPFKFSSVIFIKAEREGVLKGFTGLDIILSHPFTETLSFEVKIGEQIVLPPKDFRKVILMAVVSSCPDYDVLKEHLQFIRTTLTPIYE